MKLKTVLFLFLFPIFCRSIVHQHEITSFCSLQDPTIKNIYYFGLRYRPKIASELWQRNSIILDCNISADLSYEISRNSDSDLGEVKTDLYRGWLRLTSDQYEIRSGLQRINFGPARLLRSLQWFDSLDPRDPLQETHGIYAVSARYFFLDNSSVWLWTVLDHPKEVNFSQYESQNAEFGGRYQFPIWSGETAFSYNVQELANQYSDVIEQKFAWDGRLDHYLGWWFELVVTNYSGSEKLPQNTEAATLGIDYTFPWKNGILLTAEYQQIASYEERIFSLFQNSDLLALSGNYPLSLFDAVNLIAFYDLRENIPCCNFSYEMKFSFWSLFFSAFWCDKALTLDKKSSLQITVQMNL